jgi:hypothetical protein
MVAEEGETRVYGMTKRPGQSADMMKRQAECELLLDR